jgi:uncharacterized protein YndB with AHSA1/START domain
MVAQTSDRIEKRVFLRAPRSRVWRALTTPAEFGAWFGVRLEQATFRVGGLATGRLTRSGFDHLTLELEIAAMDPEHYFAYRWHPYAVEPDVDYSSEAKTLVEFRLEEAPGGTTLSVIESGFERIPLARRAKALEMNDGGWAIQVQNIAHHVAT